jgi:hypothetical protein
MSPMRRTPPRRAQRARLVVLAVLLTNVGWVVALPLLLTRPPTAAAAVLLGVLLAVLVAAYVLLLQAAVTPWVPQRTRNGLLAALVAATLALAPVCSWWAEPAQEPWAWVVGFAIGAGPLVLRWRAAVVLAAGLTGVAVLAAVLAGQSVVQTLVIAVASRPWSSPWARWRSGCSGSWWRPRRAGRRKPAWPCRRSGCASPATCTTSSATGWG